MFESRDHVYWSAFSPSGDEVALFSVSGGIRIWRYGAREHGRAIKPLEGAAEVTFSPDASRILASTPMYYDGAGLVHRTWPYYPLEHAIILDAEFGNMVGTTSEAIYAASWSPDVRADERETRPFDDLRRPVVQHAAASRRSCRRANTDDRQLATALVTVEFKKDRIAGFAVNLDLRLGTG